MPNKITEAALKKNLDSILDRVGNGSVVIVQRPQGGDVALIDAKELSSLLETLHLLKSPRNAERLFRALSRI